MKNVIFEPWVGENYKTGFNGKKIFVLGGNLYGNENEISNTCETRQPHN